MDVLARHDEPETERFRKGFIMRCDLKGPKGSLWDEIHLIQIAELARW